MMIFLRSIVLTLVALISQPALCAGLPIPAPPELNASSYAVIDANSGQMIASFLPDTQVEPASLTKLMTAYVVFQALKAEQVRLSDLATITSNAYKTGGSRMFIEQGDKVSVEDLLQGMIVQSGNDASVALAEYIAGTEGVFAELMNRYADRLGMISTHFENATGLPGEQHFSTARDMATLAVAIINEFPEYYRWYAQKEFTWNDITQDNRNKLLWQDSTVDGMKTGYTEAAGYCLVASATRNDMRLITAVMGTNSAKARIDASQALLNYGFRFFETRKLYSAGQAIDNARVWKGQSEQTTLGLNTDLFVTVPRGRWEQLTPRVTLKRNIFAPIDAGTDVGELSVTLEGEVLARHRISALTAVAKGGLWQRMTDEIRLWFD